MDVGSPSWDGESFPHIAEDTEAMLAYAAQKREDEQRATVVLRGTTTRTCDSLVWAYRSTGSDVISTVRIIYK